MRDTPKSDIVAMNEALSAARRDLEAALVLRTKLAVAYRGLIRVAAATGAHAERRRVMAQANEACPSCILTRSTFLLFTTPSWGGSYEEMDAVAEDPPPNAPSRFGWLAGYADLDRARVARRDKDLAGAEGALERALAHGENWLVLQERADLRFDQADYAGALGDLDRALALRPGEPDLLFRRAVALTRLERAEEGAATLVTGLRLESTGERARWAYDTVLRALDAEGIEHVKAKERDAALRVYEIAYDLAPSDEGLLARRTSLLAGPRPNITELEAEVQRAPDDFFANLSLDDGLSVARDWPRIKALWTAYLKRHPDDPRAHREFAGALSHLHDREAAMAEYDRACELGSTDGCTTAKRARDARDGQRPRP